LRKNSADFEARAGFWVRVIRDVGFPITVALVLLVFLLGGIMPKLDEGLLILRQIADTQQAVADQHTREIELLLRLVEMLGAGGRQ